MTLNLPDHPRMAADLLDDLEDRELPLLSWGVTTGSLGHDEAVEIIATRLAEDRYVGFALDAADVLDELIELGLVFRLPGTTPRRYRTRMAETVRLTANLRQLLIFGPHDPAALPDGWWERGRTLVADYRLHVQPRRYPRRHIPAATVLTQLDQMDGWSDLHGRIARAQIGRHELARFQVDATRSIFTSLQNDEGRGVIVGAGTGSGKTLAFYLPAYLDIAAGPPRRRRGVQALALYPRKELLRDQLREAVASARAVEPVLRDARLTPLRFGALYGDTPKTAGDFNWNRDLLSAWGGRRDNLICPYLACPGDECGGRMEWRAGDRSAGREELHCQTCGLRLDNVVLTRESLHRQPPDVLFTTTEMLNRTATDTRMGPLMGWTGDRIPRLVLLDEVHTYAGVHGAQVALVLRRWRHATRRAVTFVGLSATLQDAATFFAQLTGLRESIVDYLEPRSEDMEAEGREYALALRGDPVAGAGQLSTSIQTAMLFGRVLDTPQREFLYGSKGFLFTDDLDVTNRFFDDLRDAEGVSWGRRRYVLAGLRSPDAPYAMKRFDAGQSWDIVHRIGRPLPPEADAGGLVVGRTSSQDTGVDRDADLIVATASLEVGFNDPRVGLVLQHKTPKDTAAFVQRRGRAGRKRQTRPWTVVSLSDYGRDRLTYQSYERLFAPEIPPRRLPVNNRFVLKIQATQALLDWLGRKLHNDNIRADPRNVLRAPRTGVVSTNDEAHKMLRRLLDDLLTDATLQDELAHHLSRALLLNNDEVQALLWEPPRSLLLAVVPTARRRLGVEPPLAPARRDPGTEPGSLLPEFVTGALFDPLNVPEVLLRLPFQDEPETLPIERALREAVPGRVSRRFGHRRVDHRTWVNLPDGTGGTPTIDMDLSTWIDSHVAEGIWAPHDGRPVAVVRPAVMRLDQPDTTIETRSQGVPIWRSQIVAPVGGLYEAYPPHSSVWGQQVRGIGFATHAAGNPAAVRRVTTGAECETAYTDGRTEARVIRYVLNGEPSGLGFELTADAMRIRLAPLDLDNVEVRTYLESAAWRTIAFLTSVTDDPQLATITNVFQREWLSLVYLTAFALAAIDHPLPPRQIHTTLCNGAWRDQIRDVFRILYRETTSQNGNPRLISRLTDLSQDTRVTQALDRHGRLLWESDISSATGNLAQRAYRDTVAAAILAAALRACPDAQDNDLIVDVVAGPTSEDPCTIWLTETSLGGLGVIEQLVHAYSTDPRRFWGLVNSALGPSDHEYVDAALTRLLEHMATNPTGIAARAMTRVRNAGTIADADAAMRDLRGAWAALDGYPRHAAVAALSSRLLRPGSTATTDAAAHALAAAWSVLEAHVGFEVNAQVIAYAAGAKKLGSFGADPNMSADQVFSILWPRGGASRTQHLEHYQPYTPKPLLDRLLVRAAHDERLPEIDVTLPDWEERYRAAVAERGAVRLIAPSENADALARAVRSVPAIAVDRDVLRVYGHVDSTDRVGRQLGAVVEIHEVEQ